MGCKSFVSRHNITQFVRNRITQRRYQVVGSGDWGGYYVHILLVYQWALYVPTAYYLDLPSTYIVSVPHL